MSNLSPPLTLRKIRMNSFHLAHASPLAFSNPPPRVPSFQLHRSHFHARSLRLSSSSAQSHSDKAVVGTVSNSGAEKKLGFFDGLLLELFRKKMAQEVGWDSEKPGYEGLIEVANRLMMKGRSNSETIEAAVRILNSLFPPFLVQLYRALIAPIGKGKLAAEMVARVTAFSCQWLMGPCKVNSVDLRDGSTCCSGVFVERCRYLEESKCVGICTNTCKLPTQTFFRDYMGIPLLMEPNFQDYSCQFTFGVLPPVPEEDSALREPCLAVCPNAGRRREMSNDLDVAQCPKA